MKEEIEIGTNVSTGEKVFFNVLKLMLTRLLICANSGGGKSYTIRLIAEKLFGMMPIIIFDWEGEFTSLREKFDFVLVGKGGETPADCRSAKLLCHKLLELRASAIIDLSEMELPERHRFMRLFCEAAINSPKEYWRKTCFIFDEVDVVCPENGKGSSEAKNAVIAFPVRGRKRQFLSIFATQRLHKLALDARAEFLNRMVGMTFEPDDLKVAHGILGVSGKDEVAKFNHQMRTMEPGHFYAFGRSISLTPILVKVGDVKTTHGIAEAKHAGIVPATPAKIRKLLPQLADLPNEAIEAEQTMSELRAKCSRLASELKDALNRTPAPAVEKKPKIVEVPKLTARQESLLKRVGDALETVQKTLSKCTEGVTHATDLQLSLHTRLVESVPPVAATVSHPITPKPAPRAVAPAPRLAPLNGNESGSGEIAKGARQILIAAAGFPDGIDDSLIAVMTGYKSTSRRVFKQQLISRGLLVEGGLGYVVTETGRAALGSDYKPLPTGAALREHWLTRLSGGELTIYKFLIEKHPGFATNEEIQSACNYKATSVRVFKQQLKARRVIEESSEGVRINPNLY